MPSWKVHLTFLQKAWLAGVGLHMILGCFARALGKACSCKVGAKLHDIACVIECIVQQTKMASHISQTEKSYGSTTAYLLCVRLCLCGCALLGCRHGTLGLLNRGTRKLFSSGINLYNSADDVTDITICINHYSSNPCSTTYMCTKQLPMYDVAMKRQQPHVVFVS